MQTTEQPISQAQHLANIANSLLSTGPRTEAGKAKSCMNARRHGLTGQFYVMDEEDRLAYTDFERGILSALAPVGPYETQYAVAISQEHWRLNRSRATEYNTFGLGHNDFAGRTETDSPDIEVAVAQAQTWARDHHSLTKMTLYEARINRAIARHEKRLDELQRVRKAAEAKAQQEAEDLLRLRMAKGEPITSTVAAMSDNATQSGLIPTEALSPDTIQVNGFVFSTPKILAEIHRKDQLDEVAYYKAHAWKPAKPWPGPANTLSKAA